MMRVLRAIANGALKSTQPLLQTTHPPTHLHPVSRSNGTLEFSIKGKNTDAFFPVRVNFSSAETLCPIQVTSIIPADASPGDKALRYSVSTSLTVEEFLIE